MASQKGLEYTRALGGWKQGDFWLIVTNSSDSIQWSETISINEGVKSTCLVQTSDCGYALRGWIGGDWGEDIMIARVGSESS